MAKPIEVTIRYVRKFTIKQEFGSLDAGGEEVWVLDEGEDPSAFRRERWEAMRQEAFDFLAETVEAIKAKPTPGSQRADPLPPPGREQGRPTGVGRPVDEQLGLQERAPLPDEPKSADEPKYDDAGNRIRKSGFGGNDGFVISEINEVWQMLFDGGVFAARPDHSAQANQDRQHVRAWLRMTPLDPGFSQEQAQFVVDRYKVYQGEGLTTKEALAEVGYEYIGHFFRGEDAPAEGGDDSDAGGGDQEAADGEAEAQPDDQEPGDDEGEAEQPTLDDIYDELKEADESFDA